MLLKSALKNQNQEKVENHALIYGSGSVIGCADLDLEEALLTFMPVWRILTSVHKSGRGIQESNILALYNVYGNIANIEYEYNEFQAFLLSIHCFFFH